MVSDYVTIEITRKAHETLRILRHEFYLETDPDVIDKLIEEHLQRQEGR